MPQPPWRVRWRAPQGEWPDEARLTLDIGRATSAGQELRPFLAKVGYGARSFALEQLKIGQASGVMLEGAGSFDRVATSGKLTLNSSAASLGQITGLIAPLAPALAARLNAMGRKSRSDAPQAVARSGQDRAAGRSRQRARRVRSGYAPAQGRRHDRGKARHRGPARHRSRGARTQRVHARIADCRPARAVHCWPRWGSIARSRRAMARRNSKARCRACGVRRCG